MQITGTSVSDGTCLGRQEHQRRQAGYIGQRDDGAIGVHSACAGKVRAQISTFSWVVLESSVWSQDLRLPAQLRSVGLTAWRLACCVTLCKSSGCVAARREGHMSATHFSQKSMLLATSLPKPLPPALAGIRGLSPGAPGLQGAGLVRGVGRRAEVFMLQAVSSVLELRFRLPEEFPQYPRKLRALVDVFVPVAEV